MTPYYADESVTLYHGDAMLWLLEADEASVDAIITDPPYSSGGAFRGDRVQPPLTKYLGAARANPLPDFGGDNRDQRGFGYWCTLWLTQCYRVAKAGAVLTVSTDWRQLPVVTDVIQSAGWTWRGVLAWAKPDARPQFGRPRQACEFIVWATKGPRPLVGACLPGWWLAQSPRDRHHQTEKPLMIYRDLVKLAPEGGTILDPFCGSGTTGVGALLEGRRFVGVEASHDYVSMAAARLAKAAGRGGALDAQDALPMDVLLRDAFADGRQLLSVLAAEPPPSLTPVGADEEAT